MASISKLGKGKQPLRAIDFIGLSGRRQRLRLGKVTHDMALEYKRRVEKLLAAKRLNQTPDQDTIHWLSGLPFDVRTKLAKLMLCSLPDDQAQNTSFGAFCETYKSRKKVEIKPSSYLRLNQAIERMKLYFAPNLMMDQFTPALAKDWRTKLLKDGLSDASIRTNIRYAKAVFKDAIERDMLTKNPFRYLASSAVAADRTRYVTPEETTRLINATDDHNWKCLIGLARYAGLRVPSESHVVKWADIDWESRRLSVFGQKTNTHRVVPLMPEMLELLKNASQGLSKTKLKGPIVDLTQHNRHRQFPKIIEKAGMEPWPDLFQTLRRSCETHMSTMAPQHAVSAWIGHSEEVSRRHYLQMTDGFFEMVNQPVLTDPLSSGAAKSAAESAAVNPGTVSQAEADSPLDGAGHLNGGIKKPDNCRVFPSVTMSCYENTQAPPVGLEPTTNGLTVHSNSYLICPRFI